MKIVAYTPMGLLTINSYGRANISSRKAWQVDSQQYEAKPYYKAYKSNSYIVFITILMCQTHHMQYQFDKNAERQHPQNQIRIFEDKECQRLSAHSYHQLHSLPTRMCSLLSLTLVPIKFGHFLRRSHSDNFCVFTTRIIRIIYANLNRSIWIMLESLKLIAITRGLNPYEQTTKGWNYGRVSENWNCSSF